MSSNKNLDQRIAALGVDIKKIRAELKKVKKGKPSFTKFEKLRKQLGLANQENSVLAKQTFKEMNRLYKKSSKRNKPYFKKIIIGNLIAIFIWSADIDIGSSSSLEPSGTLFGLVISGLELPEVILGFWCYLLYLYIGILRHAVISEIYPMNAINQLNNNLGKVAKYRIEISKLNDAIILLLSVMDAKGLIDVTNSQRKTYIPSWLSILDIPTIKNFIDTVLRKMGVLIVNEMLDKSAASILTFIVVVMTGSKIGNHYNLPIDPAILATLVLILFHFSLYLLERGRVKNPKNKVANSKEKGD
jgi:hypothetical protein